MEDEIREKIDQACRTGEEFTKVYYESLDKRRHLISKLYLDTATMIWNGNGVDGKDAIQKFWIELPSSDHNIITLDAQPITGPAVANQLTFLLKVSGMAKYQDKSPRPFNQNFLITAIGDKWKIVSDCFRMQEVIDN
ncbi:NTF2-related export protein [Leptopilina boulardi]|uniref:NTF2-related export protein n=1 Tax=Leptopilina boulardi TaxID=63433 RepID=UPI0021F511EA|nr:NTF2-related export protein [Leptopilina boulardi]